MAKKKESPYWPRICIDWTPNGVEVEIREFEKLSPVKIDKCFQAALKEWYRLRTAYASEHRKQEREERIGAENG